MSDSATQCSMTSDDAHTWALVLGAGEGTRLHALTTTPAGIAIPKQYCSLSGGTSLLHDALGRAGAVAPLERTCRRTIRRSVRTWIP